MAEVIFSTVKKLKLFQNISFLNKKSVKCRYKCLDRIHNKNSQRLYTVVNSQECFKQLPSTSIYFYKRIIWERMDISLINMFSALVSKTLLLHSQIFLRKKFIVCRQSGVTFSKILFLANESTHKCVQHVCGYFHVTK